MKTFEDEAPVRLVLPWEPPVTQHPRMWESVLADGVDTPEVREILGHFNRWKVAGGEIHFFMHTTKRRLEVKRLMQHDKGWKRFMKVRPEARVEWAEDVKG